MKPILLLPGYSSECKYMFSQWSVLRCEISIPTTSMEVTLTTDIKLPPIFQYTKPHKKRANVHKFELPPCYSLFSIINEDSNKKLRIEHCNLAWIQSKNKKHLKTKRRYH